MAIVAIAAVAAMLIATSMIATDSVFAKKYRNRIVEQVDDCGNYELPINETCSNSGLNIEEQENIDNMTTIHYSLLPFP